MRRLSIWCRIYLGLVAFSIFGTLLSKFSGLDPGPIKPIAATLTLLSGAWTLISLFMKSSGVQKGVVGTVAVFLVGIASEVCGILTGIPFGKYEYTTNWSPVVNLPGGQNFPLLLPLAWFLVAGGSALAFSRFGWVSAFLGAVLATLIDLVMEPVMTGKLAYWRWLESGPLPGGAPWMNVFGWFVTSLIAGLILMAFKEKKVSSPEPIWVLGGHLLLIGVIAIA